MVGSYNHYALKSFLALNLVRFVATSKADSAKDDDNKEKEQKQAKYKRKFSTKKTDLKRKNLLSTLIE